MSLVEIDACDVIKPYEGCAEEQVVTKTLKKSPFEFMTAVSETKKDMIAQEPEVAKDYVAYIINRGFGFFPDTVLHANEMNIHSCIPDTAQFYYYMGSLRKRKRFSKWHKLEKNDDIVMVQKLYGVRPEIAKQYLKLLTEQNLSDLRTLSETGEQKPTKK
jgi:hypothetical protein